MVIRTVPKNALFREVSAKFSFDYMVTGVNAGRYVCTNPSIEVLKFTANNFYLIDQISVSGSVAETVFVDSVDQTDIITLQLLRKNSNELISAQRLSISQYLKEHSISSHVECNRGNDGVMMKVGGVINQVIDTIGVDTISLTFTMSTYQISGVEYNEFYRGIDNGVLK